MSSDAAAFVEDLPEDQKVEKKKKKKIVKNNTKMSLKRASEIAALEGLPEDQKVTKKKKKMKIDSHLPHPKRCVFCKKAPCFYIEYFAGMKDKKSFVTSWSNVLSLLLFMLQMERMYGMKGVWCGMKTWCGEVWCGTSVYSCLKLFHKARGFFSSSGIFLRKIS